jgi:hypothetical protein
MISDPGISALLPESLGPAGSKREQVSCAEKAASGAVGGESPSRLACLHRLLLSAGRKRERGKEEEADLSLPLFSPPIVTLFPGVNRSYSPVDN